MAVSGNNNFKMPATIHFNLTRPVGLEVTVTLNNWLEVGHCTTIRNRAGFPEASLKG